MHKRNKMEAAHLEHILTFIITHMKEVAADDSGERSGEHMVMHSLEGRKPLDQVGIRDELLQTCLRTLNFQIEF